MLGRVRCGRRCGVVTCQTSSLNPPQPRPQVLLISADFGEVLGNEMFDSLEEARNRVQYAISPGAAWVLVYVTDTCHVANW